MSCFAIRNHSQRHNQKTSMTLIRSSGMRNRLAEKKKIANPWGYTKGGGGERGGMVMNQIETCKLS